MTFIFSLRIKRNKEAGSTLPLLFFVLNLICRHLTRNHILNARVSVLIVSFDFYELKWDLSARSGCAKIATERFSRMPKASSRRTSFGSVAAPSPSPQTKKGTHSGALKLYLSDTVLIKVIYCLKHNIEHLIHNFRNKDISSIKTSVVVSCRCGIHSNKRSSLDASL